MEIYFKTNKQARIFNDERAIKGKYSQAVAKALVRKLGMLRASETLDDYRVLDQRLELLTGGEYEYSIRLSANYRLIFSPIQPVLLKSDGGVDERNVREIVIEDVVDYH